jgi:uncharacterized membrane protein HdeD (DUF308 family)
MATVSPENIYRHPVFGDARKNWGWLLGMGVLSVVLGIVGLWMAVFLTLAGVLLFAVLLGAGGVVQLVDAFKCRDWKGTLINALIGLIYLAVGILMVFEPLRAAVALTLILGVAFIVIGLLRDSVGWGWALAGGVVSILLGVVVMAGWPVSGLWVIGVIIAVELLVNGWTYIFFGLAARRADRDLAARGTGGAAEPPG